MSIKKRGKSSDKKRKFETQEAEFVGSSMKKNRN